MSVNYREYNPEQRYFTIINGCLPQECALIFCLWKGLRRNCQF